MIKEILEFVRSGGEVVIRGDNDNHAAVIQIRGKIRNGHEYALQKSVSYSAMDRSRNASAFELELQAAIAEYGYEMDFTTAAQPD